MKINIKEGLSEGEKREAQGKWWIMAVVILGTIVVSFNATILNIALPKIMASLRVDVDEIRWVITGYMITMAILMPTIGWLGERFGNRNVFLGSLALFTLTSILCGIAWDIESLVFFRVIQGIAAGPILPLGMVILYEAFPKHQRGYALGIYTLGMTLGPAMGPTIGGWIVEGHSWRWVFYLNVPVCIPGLLLGGVVLPRVREKTTKRPLDFWGLLLLALFLITLLVALSQGNIEGWDSSYVVSLLMAAAASCAVFIFRELKTPSALVELRVFMIRNFSIVATVAMINYVGMMGTFFLASIFLQRALGFTPLRAGLFLLPASLTMGGTSVLTGSLSDRVNPKYLILSGLGMQVVAFYIFSTINTLTGLMVIQAAFLFRSFSTAWIVTPLSSAAMQTLPPELYRQGSGFLALMRGIGGSMGIAVTTSFLSYRISWNTIWSLGGVDASSISISEAMRNLSQYLASLGENTDLIETKSLLLIARRLLEQAMLTGYQNTFILLAIVFSLAIIPTLFISLPTAKKGEGKASHGFKAGG